MIIISGNTFNIYSLENDYPKNSIEWQLLNTMSDSEARYIFDNVEQLQFEILLRKEIVDASKLLNRSDFSFEVFHKSYCNRYYWNRTANGGFDLKEGVSPSKAISDIYINGDLYATECATAMQIVYYKALINVYNEELFNKTFPKIYLMNWHNITPLLKETGTPIPVEDILTGDRCYINNPDFDPKTPQWQGENVIVLGNGLYYGHGIGITTLNRIIRSLNSERRRNATRSAYFMESTAARPNFKKLAGIMM